MIISLSTHVSSKRKEECFSGGMGNWFTFMILGTSMTSSSITNTNAPPVDLWELSLISSSLFVWMDCTSTHPFKYNQEHPTPRLRFAYRVLLRASASVDGFCSALGHIRLSIFVIFTTFLFKVVTSARCRTLGSDCLSEPINMNEWSSSQASDCLSSLYVAH